MFEITRSVCRPEIAVTWRRADGRSLSGSSHEHFNTVLKIDNVDDYDEATYICTGSNTEGNTDQLIRVEVNGMVQYMVIKAFPINAFMRCQVFVCAVKVLFLK